MSLLAATERLSAPLDWFRRGWFSWVVRNEVARATLAHRDLRITTIACVSVLGAAFGAVYAPVLMFTLGPVLFGVAHVAADVRYLVLRRHLARWWQNSVWIGCALLLAVRVLEEAHALRHTDHLELALAAGFVALALCAGLRDRGSQTRALCAGVLLGAITSCAWTDPKTARYVFVHLHNVVALLAWATLFRANKRWLLAPAALIVLATGLLASGALYRQTIGSPLAASFHLHVFTVSDWVAPLKDARLAVGITTAYLFLQSVHYSAWLNWIPQEEQTGRGTLTFRMSARSLFRDLGAPGVAAVTVAAVAVLLGACFDLHRARGLYLSLAMFHGYLELALLAFFWVRGSASSASVCAHGDVAARRGALIHARRDAPG